MITDIFHKIRHNSTMCAHCASHLLLEIRNRYITDLVSGRFISIDSSLKPVLYWLKDGKQLAISKRMQRRTKENSDSKTLESTIDFDTPNEGDLGT